MKSIRSTLLARLLVAMALSFAIGGAGIYSIVRGGMMASVDEQLSLASAGAKELLSAERRTVRPTKQGRAAKRWIQFEQEENGLYFQAWNREDAPVARSTSLGDISLPRPGPHATADRPFTLTLPDGRRVRALSFQVNPQAKRSSATGRDDMPFAVVIARDLEDTDHALSLLLGGIAASGLIVSIGGVLLIAKGLRKGLAPLERLGEQAATIQVESLASRFDDRQLPSELVPIAQRLNDLMARLESGFERERRFSADLAHEIRTPIAELRAMAETALRWPDQTSSADFSGILETTRIMQTMVEKLLALARWESQTNVIATEPVALAEFLDDCWAPHEKPAAERQITLRRDVPSDLIWQSDPAILRHIIENLLANAVEYSAPHGSIHIFADDMSARISNPAHNLCGQDVSRLFERCWRHDPARSGSSHFGLGLPLARACAEVLGMTLTATLDHDILSFELRRQNG
jgi:signal transduction histidine kinase